MTEAPSNKMVSKGIMYMNKGDMKQFKRASGSPITYAKFRGNKGILVPLKKPRPMKKKERPLNKHHMCIVYSKVYGREVYENVDIWPEITDKDGKKVLKVSGGSVEDIPDDQEEHDEEQQRDNHEEEENEEETEEAVEQKDTVEELCCEHVVPHQKSPDERHVTIITVTDTSEDTEYSSEKQVHPAPESPTSTQGNWPLKRSQSVDSRDNPFCPGGNLSQEADEILARATIIRDTFILKDADGNVQKQTSHAQQNAESESVCPKDDHIVNQAQSPVNETPVVEETVTSKTVQNAESAPNAAEPATNADTANAKPKENGQVETDDSLSPGSVRLEEIPEENKDRKKQKKCCSIM